MTDNTADRPGSELTRHDITVFLVDDQAMIGEAVRRMLAADPEIHFHFCSDPTQAVAKATEIRPTVILQDLVMPEIDGLTLVKFFRAHPATCNVPLIVLSTKEEPVVKAEAFALGANDYLVKLPDKIELIARVRYHSKAYINLLERNEAYDALLKSQKALATELAEAAAYVRATLPAPLTGDVRTDWRFIPSTALGGDVFGYHWMDDNHLAAYLLDVCGHGVGAALLSITVQNVIRSQSLPNTNFLIPRDVLQSLNETFPMEQHNGMFFTIWYGVFDKARRRLTYASGGHPPAILIMGDDRGTAQVVQLTSSGSIIGGLPGMSFEAREHDVGSHARLYVFSDGVYEVNMPDESIWTLDQFIKVLSAPPEPGMSDLDRVVTQIRKLSGSETFQDDFSLLEINL